MPGFGFGFGSVSSSQHFATLSPDSGVTALSPSVSWDGTVGSGFAVAPTDSARTTSKPACRLITPPNQYFSDELIVGVVAAANNNGSLFDGLGMEKVVIHYEGATTEILAPSYYFFEDANGVIRKHLGFWAVLRHDGRQGHAHVYFEAAPKDATMQNRVMGPYQFSPQAALHDYALTVEPSQSVIAGSRYQTIAAAMGYCRSQSAENPLITITEAGDYDLGYVGSHMGEGYCNITASAPITIRRTTPDKFRTKYDGMRFVGSNITIDFANAFEIYHESGERQHWFDGINLINSAGRGALWDKGIQPVGWAIRNYPWFTECNIQTIQNVGSKVNLMRGCTLSNGWNDVFTAAKCVVGNHISDWHSEDYTNGLEALTVQYTGSASAATLALSGGNNTSDRVLTAKEDGVEIATFTIENKLSDPLGATNFHVHNVVDWLDGLTDWSATLLDDTRGAGFLGLTGTNGTAFGDTDVKSAALTLAAQIDVHTDFFQLRANDTENYYIADNIGIDVRAQLLFLGDSVKVWDMIVINNALIGNQLADEPPFSGMDGANSHVVVAHNSLPSQGMRLRADFSYGADNYCLLANNVFAELNWMGTPEAGGVIKDNHLHGFATAPTYSTSTVLSGDETSLFADAAGGDFAPAGDLASNLKAPVVKFDRAANERGATAAVGG